MQIIKEKSFGIIPLQKTEEGWKVFLVQLKSGAHWGFPKGHGEEKENAKEVAKRELFEETQLSVSRFLKNEPLIEHYSYQKNRSVHEKTVYYFLAEVEGIVILQKEEIINGQWVLLSQAKRYITHSSSKELCDQIIKILDHFRR